MIVLLALVILIVGSVFTIKLVNASKTKITSHNGIDEQLYVELGGIEQFIHIRGQNTSNPVIIFLHGGPGFPIKYLSYYYQLPIEEKYTIINWDQRGSGRTFYKNCKMELSFDGLFKDLDELVSYAKQRFYKDKVIIIGQSWGSVLGSTYTVKHPENVIAYIGLGQITDFDQGKVLAAERAIEFAEQSSNIEDVEILKETIEEFIKSKSVDEIDIANLETMIVTSLKYLKGKNEIEGLKQAYSGIVSPYMNINDLKWFLNAANTQRIFDYEKELVNYMYYEFDVFEMNTQFLVPVCFIQGSNDWITPTEMANDYLSKLNAPVKKMYSISGAGHTPFLDMPGEYSKMLLDFLDSILE